MGGGRWEDKQERMSYGHADTAVASKCRRNAAYEDTHGETVYNHKT